MGEVFEFLGLPAYENAEYKKYNPGSYDPVNDSMGSTLSDFFKPYNKMLEELLDKQFNWQ